MKTKALIILLVFGCMVSSIWSGCVSTYRSMQPAYLPMDYYQDSITGADHHIAMDFDVLIGAHNKLYAKMEKKNKVSLITLSVQNSGHRELCLTQDLVFQTSNGDTILPLDFFTAMEALVDPVTDEDNESFIEVDLSEAPVLNMIRGTWRLVNDIKRVNSHIKFTTDMETYYIEDQILSPGSSTEGFLVLPVQKGTFLEVSFRQ